MTLLRFGWKNYDTQPAVVLSLFVTPPAPREERFLKNNFVVESVRRTVPKKERFLKNNFVVESVQPSAPRKGRFLKKKKSQKVGGNK
jgi:hypothetical protein